MHLVYEYIAAGLSITFINAGFSLESYKELREWSSNNKIKTVFPRVLCASKLNQARNQGEKQSKFCAIFSCIILDFRNGLF